MKRERSKSNNAILLSGADAGIDIPTVQINLPNSDDLVSQLFEKEQLSRMQIKDMTANGGVSYLEIQHILATKTFLSDEDRKAFQESVHKVDQHPEPSKLSGHKSPFEELINRVTSLIAALFGLEGDKKDSNWLRANLFNK